MKTRILFVVAMLMAVASPSFATDLETLRERFRQRFPEIRAAKTEGKIGEVMSSGLIEAVGGADAALGRLIAAENADRRELYEIIARQENTTPDVVARRNAERNFQEGRSGDYFKTPDGQWRRKR